MTSRMFKLLFGSFVLLLMQLPAKAGVIKHVIVVAMENTDAEDIYGNTSEAPYINNVLTPQAARSSNFIDILPGVPSLPHYILMEAGTNKLPDKTFIENGEPTASFSTGSRDHLTAQMRATVAPNKVTWMSYQQSLSSNTGACPIQSDYPYAPRHNPFVYFRDVSGNPPSKTRPYCAAHHKDYTALAADLAANRIANYVFITPDNCNNMHDQCPGSTSRIRSGDDWLASALPPLITWANANSGVVLVLWDEGSSTNELAFFAVGPGVKANFVSDMKLTHRSLVSSVETIFGLPILPTVATARTFKSLFKAGQFP